jgi:phosphonate transport system permease protein
MSEMRVMVKPAGRLSAEDTAALMMRHPQVFRTWTSGRVLMLALTALAVLLVLVGFAVLGFSFERFWNGLGRLGTAVGLMLPPTTNGWARFWTYLHALGETVAIAFLGTLAGAALALPIGFLAARNVIPNWIFNFITRRIMDTVRGVDELIWALIFINVVGLGPFAGALAVTVGSFGFFCKVFSETIEAADDKPSEGVASTGGTAFQRARFGLLPQVLPIMAGQVLYLFESNTRSATIIGIVGAGGIGLFLAENIRTLEWQHVSAIILMILVAVAAIDWVSSRLRFAIIGKSNVTL